MTCIPPLDAIEARLKSTIIVAWFESTMYSFVVVEFILASNCIGIPPYSVSRDLRPLKGSRLFFQEIPRENVVN